MTTISRVYGNIVVNKIPVDSLPGARRKPAFGVEGGYERPVHLAASGRARGIWSHRLLSPVLIRGALSLCQLWVRMPSQSE